MKWHGSEIEKVSQAGDFEFRNYATLLEKSLRIGHLGFK